jgi:2-polyprenyl-3-methyl-5-hydroxy-6-metoxy-1,4-benzoquinol methylase
MTVSFQKTIPILRIFSVAKAKEFYVNYLGFSLDWEHHFEEITPAYLQVSREGLLLHLSEHHGDCCPGSTVFVWMTGIEEFHREITSKKYKYLRPGIENTFYDAKCVEVIDPFGNRIRFNEACHTVPRQVFENAYAGQAPWDIGKPQKPFIDRANQIVGAILDSGCGTGDTALFFAGRGLRVTGIDFLDVPIERAKRKAAEQGLTVSFLVKDALTLKDWSERFDSVIDSGLFHIFSNSDRTKYVEGLASVLKPGGRLFLMCFSDEEPGTQGPRRVSKKELHDAFAAGWHIESIEPVRLEIRPDFKEFALSEGGPKAWFAVVRRS